MADGKASIKFLDDRCNVFLQNCPPGTLMLFLKTMYIKLSNDQASEKQLTKEEVHNKIKERLLSEKPSSFDEISPITNQELARAKKMALPKSSLTTPSPPQKKRKIADNTNLPIAKKLYAPSPLAKQNPKQKETRPEDPAIMEVLNEEQNQVLQTCLKGSNIFFTGSAGTGWYFWLFFLIPSNFFLGFSRKIVPTPKDHFYIAAGWNLRNRFDRCGKSLFLQRPFLGN
jgi:ATP-dependent DNA helicase PIF1